MSQKEKFKAVRDHMAPILVDRARLEMINMYKPGTVEPLGEATIGLQISTRPIQSIEGPFIKRDFYACYKVLMPLRPLVPLKDPSAREILQEHVQTKIHATRGSFQDVKPEGTLVIYWCYDENTEILTSIGWKSIQNIEDKDEVMTLNRETFELEYQLPSHIFINHWSGPMVEFRSKTVDLLVIPEHQMFAKTRYKDWSLISARELVGRRVKFTKVGKWTQGKSMNKDVLRLLGWYISEGSYQKNWIRIYQLKSEEKRKRIGQIIERLGYKPHFWSRCVAFKADETLLSLCKESGSHALEKRIPRQILSLNKESLKALYGEMMLGDGYDRKNSAQFITSSEQLAGDFQELLLKIGYAGDIEELKKRQNAYSARQLFHIYIKRKRLMPEMRPREVLSQKSRLTSYDGLIWSVSVPNKIICVRRNGKIMFSGNTDFWVTRDGEVWCEGAEGVWRMVLQLPEGLLQASYLNLRSTLHVKYVV